MFTCFWVRRYPPDVFAPLYERLEEAIDAGAVRASVEVRRELEKQDDDLLAWAKERPHLFIEIDGPQQDAVTGILEAFPRLTDSRRGQADPWVIAVAQVNGAAVVTDEIRSSQASKKRPRIPDVCDALQIPVLTPLEFIRAEKWKL